MEITKELYRLYYKELEAKLRTIIRKFEMPVDFFMPDGYPGEDLIDEWIEANSFCVMIPDFYYSGGTMRWGNVDDIVDDCERFIRDRIEEDVKAMGFSISQSRYGLITASVGDASTAPAAIQKPEGGV